MLGALPGLIESFARTLPDPDRPGDQAAEAALHCRPNHGEPMKITRVSATPLNLPITVNAAGKAKSTSLSLCIVDVETDTGLVGTRPHGQLHFPRR